MSITITSTDSDKDVQAALGNQKAPVTEKPETKVVEGEPVAASAAETPSESGTEEKPEDEERPRKSNLERRFSKLTKQKADLARANEELRAKVAAYEVAQKPPATETTQTKIDSSKKPNPDDFETNSAYQEALIDWKVEQREAIRSREVKQSEIRAEMDRDTRTYQEKLNAFMKDKPDFMERLDDVKETSISNTLQARLMKNGPEFVYALMEDPVEFKRVCALPSDEALEAVGEFKAKLKAQAALKIEEPIETKPKTKPVSPVGSKVSPEKDWSKMTVREYDQWRRAGNAPR